MGRHKRSAQTRNSSGPSNTTVQNTVSKRVGNAATLPPATTQSNPDATDTTSDIPIDPSHMSPDSPNDSPPNPSPNPFKSAAQTVEEFLSTREAQLTAELKEKIEAETRTIYGISTPGDGAAPPYAIALPLKVIRATFNAQIAGSTDNKISKPRGGLGKKDGYDLMNVLGLESDEYRAVVRTVHDLCYHARLDFSFPYELQDHATLLKISKTANNKHPILNRCENNWATTVLVRRYIKNRRKRLSKTKSLAAAASGAQYTIPDFDDIDTEDDGEDEEL